TIRLACSLTAHYERQTGKVEDKTYKEIAAEYSSNAILIICDKGANDPQLFLATLDAIISFVTDPICPMRIY
ncbi:unnamed protein product, partial [Rotaria magnacalcarata]